MKSETGTKEAVRTLLMLNDSTFGGFSAMAKLAARLAVFIAVSVFTRKKDGLETIKESPAALRWGLYFILIFVLIGHLDSSSTNFIYNNF